MGRCNEGGIALELSNLVGTKYGELLVLEQFKKKGRHYCKCLCDCGNVKPIGTLSLLSGRKATCGCRRKRATCHPDRVHEGFGLCLQCYMHERRKDKDFGKQRQLAADCHPERQHRALGLCNTCYTKHLRETDRLVPKSRTKEEVKIQSFRVKLKRYGFSQEDYDKLFVLQDGKCAICLSPFSDKIKPCLDHNHNTNKARGLLCRECNSGLGFFRENLVAFERAISYIGLPPAKRIYLESTIEKAKKALEFYANPDNYTSGAASKDRGSLAREALKLLDEEI